jgi:hypothetical protein
MGQPDLAAFRLFLLGHKKPVTRVTRVTTSKSNDLACYAEAGGRVTGVTAPEPDSAPEEAEAVERQAIAETEGGVPPLYSAAFAKLQLTPPPGLSVSQWLQSTDDAGRFLDAFGAQAAALGWDADDLFASAGLVRALNGAVVIALSAATATLTDGRTFDRLG